MEVKMMLQFNGKNLTLPINPEKITIARKANNQEIEIVGLGTATRKGEPSLDTLTIESFFPAAGSFFYTGVKPKTCIEFINEIWNAENKNNNVAKFVTTGLPIDYDMYFVIDDFDYDHRAGEEEDIYYKLTIKKYVPYGAKIVDVQLSGLASARASALAESNSSNNYYIVKSGDCLWSITKASIGDGSRWKELYNLNKTVIGANPNLIYPGQKLLLPSGWKSPNSSGGTVAANKSVRTANNSSISNNTSKADTSTRKAEEAVFAIEQTVMSAMDKLFQNASRYTKNKRGWF